MGWFTGFVLYAMIYWVALFAILPWGNKPADEVVEGNVASAPSNPHMKQKFIITAFVALVLWLTVYVLIKMDVIDFYQIGKQMADEDFK